MNGQEILELNSHKIHHIPSIAFNAFSFLPFKTLTSAKKLPTCVVLGFVVTMQVTTPVLVQRVITIIGTQEGKHAKVRKEIRHT